MADNTTHANEVAYIEDSLKYLTTQERAIFFWVFLTIFIVALTGNVAAVIATARGTHRYIQKICIISLALSDLIMVTFSSINYLETFSHPLVNWTLGEFMCSAIPTLQIMGVIGSSMSLVAIALDRYSNVVHALTKRWNPGPVYCLIGTVIAWLICAGLSSPMWILFDYKTTNVLFMNGSIPLYIEKLAFCVSAQKNELMVYNICIAVVVFLPLIVTFLWLYYHIAELVWRHRKPLSTLFYKKEENSMETSTSQIKSSEATDKSSASVEAHLHSITKRNRNVHVERKIRTFKIIVMLMLVFFICRIPYHTFVVMKLVQTYNEHKYWIITYVINGLVLINCALNPFLYTFLTPTLNILLKIHKILIKDFFCKVCCCCCSNAEFEDFEKDNPFIVENFDQRKVSGPRISSPHSSRYANRNSRVKFEARPQVQVYAHKEEVQESTSCENKF